MTPIDHAPILLLALIIDAIIGDPDWVYRLAPHPVVLFGRIIGWFDQAWNRDTLADGARRLLGAATVLIILTLAAGIGWLIQTGLRGIPYAIALEALIASLFLAQNSLYRHVAAVAYSLINSDGDLRAAQVAVGRIVGRDTTSLDKAEICRAAIESLAENFSDGVAAPVFWYLLLGLPGLLAYKALNTADSMIGHLSDRHRAFGWAAARLDDFANYLPARLGAIALAGAAVCIPGMPAKTAIRAAIRDASEHRSVNAGWPEAAMAGALGLRIAGPRRYEGVLVEDAWMGDGCADARPDDIRWGLRLYAGACLILAAGTAILSAV